MAGIRKTAAATPWRFEAAHCLSPHSVVRRCQATSAALTTGSTQVRAMMQDICIKIAGRSHHCWTKPGGSHEGPSQESSSSTFLQKRVKWPKCLMLLPNDGLLLSGMWSSSSGPKVPPTTKVLEKEVRRPLSQRLWMLKLIHAVIIIRNPQNGMFTYSYLFRPLRQARGAMRKGVP